MWEQISPPLLLKIKVSGKFVTVWRRDLRYPVLTDFLPFSKHFIQHGAQVAEIAFSYPLNDCKVVFFFLQNREKLVVSSLRKVKPLHPRCALVQRAVYLNLGETIGVENYIYCLYAFIIHNSCLISHWSHSAAASVTALYSSTTEELKPWSASYSLLPLAWKMNADCYGASFLFLFDVTPVCMYAVSLGRIKWAKAASVVYIATGFVWQWVPVSLQRPVLWTTAAVTARVTTRSQECAVAVLLASLCSQTAKPVKVKHHPHINLLAVVFSVTFELPFPPEVCRNRLFNLRCTHRLH